MTDLRFKSRKLQTHQVDENGELILHDPSNGQMVVLNSVGAAAYELLDGTRTLRDVVEELASAFEDVPVSQIERDVKAFIEDMLERGLVLSTGS